MAEDEQQLGSSPCGSSESHDGEEKGGAAEELEAWHPFRGGTTRQLGRAIRTGVMHTHTHTHPALLFLPSIKDIPKDLRKTKNCCTVLKY